MLSKLKQNIETVDPQVQIRLRLRTNHQLTLHQIQLEYVRVISVNFTFCDAMIQLQTIYISKIDGGLFFIGLLGVAKLRICKVQEEVAKLKFVGRQKRCFLCLLL